MLVCTACHVSWHRSATGSVETSCPLFPLAPSIARVARPQHCSVFHVYPSLLQAYPLPPLPDLVFNLKPPGTADWATSRSDGSWIANRSFLVLSSVETPTVKVLPHGEESNASKAMFMTGWDRGVELQARPPSTFETCPGGQGDGAYSAGRQRRRGRRSV